jgi:hypothetical protein
MSYHFVSSLNNLPNSIFLLPLKPLLDKPKYLLMITREQAKELEKRRDALRRHL